MPWRELNRLQGWLMPPTMEELLPEDHPARVVAAFVDSLTPEDWTAIGVPLEPQRMGVPAYHPRALLGVWIYGFMTGLRSSRKLEAACREQLPYLWLAGGQQPDHNTLWRFYQAHRAGMRSLLRKTIEAAEDLDLIDWDLQAADGTKIQGDASNRLTFNEEQLQRLEERSLREIEQLEASHDIGNASAPNLTEPIAEARTSLHRIRMAQHQLQLSANQRFVSLVDADARMMRRPHGGTVTGYNAQAVSARLRAKGREGESLLLLAAEVTQSPVDTGELPRLVEAAAEVGRAELTVADAGYFSADTLGLLREQGKLVVMPEGRTFKDHPYHWRHFRYEPERDRYRCPEDKPLRRRQQKFTRQTPAKLYGADPADCRACRAFGDCTTSELHGRTITISEQSEALEQHRRWMQTERAEAALRRRPGLIESVFGIIKERQAGHRFLLRSIEAVEAEWSLLATAFNLRALSKHWRRLFELLAPEPPTPATES